MLPRALLLLLITFAASLPTLTMSGMRGTEGRRAQIAFEMLAAGDWMVPTIGFEPTWAKPPLHYWLLGAAAEWLGPDTWLLRLPSVLVLFATALCALVLLRRYFGEGAGWVGALGVVCSPIVVFEWATAEIDPIFAGLTATSLWFLATGVARERRGLVWVAGILGGLAILQKGPPYLVFAAGAWLVWWRRRGFRYAVTYFVPLLAVPLCYYVPLWVWWVAPTEMMAVAQAESVGRIGGFTWQHVLETPAFWLRAVSVQLPLLLWCFWEWRGARDARMDANDLTLRMCSGAAVFAVVLLSFFPGRPTRYLLPNIPLFTFAVAPAVAHFAGQRRRLGGFSRRALRIVAVAGALGLVAMPFLVDRAGIALAGALLCAALAWIVVRTPRQLVAYVLVLPVVVGLTVGWERAAGWAATKRAAEPLGRVLARELAALDVTADELETYGHVDGRVLLGGGLLPRGDEACRRPPSAPWLLHSAGGVVGELPTGYVDRLWVGSPAGHLEVRQRVPR